MHLHANVILSAVEQGLRKCHGARIRIVRSIGRSRRIVGHGACRHVVSASFDTVDVDDESVIGHEVEHQIFLQHVGCHVDLLAEVIGWQITGYGSIHRLAITQWGIARGIRRHIGIPSGTVQRTVGIIVPGGTLVEQSDGIALGILVAPSDKLVTGWSHSLQLNLTYQRAGEFARWHL